MPWIKTDDDFYDHPAWLGASCGAVGAWLLLKAWANRNLTDGLIPDLIPARLGITDEAMKELEERGRVHAEINGWSIHDYLDYQPSRETVLRDREERAQRRSAAGKKAADARWHGDEIRNACDDDANAMRSHAPNPNPNPKKEIRVAKATQVIFDAWRESTGKTRSILDGKRKRLIEARLKEFSADDLALAVTGWARSPFHSGENDQRKTYNDLGLLLRDAAHVEQFLDFAQGRKVAAGEWFDQ